MGLAGTKKHRRLAADPNNVRWSRNTDNYGHKLLLRHGWKPGQTLGVQGSAHSAYHTAASETHIRAVLRENNFGIGMKPNSSVNEYTGLSAFQDLLGRLNGKSEAVINTEQKVRQEYVASTYMDRKYGGLKFVHGGLLVSGKLVGTDEEVRQVEAKKLEEIERTEKKEVAAQQRAAEEEVAQVDDEAKESEQEKNPKVEKEKQKKQKKNKNKKKEDKKDNKDKKDKKTKKETSEEVGEVDEKEKAETREGPENPAAQRAQATKELLPKTDEEKTGKVKKDKKEKRDKKDKKEKLEKLEKRQRKDKNEKEEGKRKKRKVDQLTSD